MNTSVRSRRRSAGFSLIELLVTILIAGVVFAAMVPLFVTASKASSRDRARNIATDVAQSRIEGIRRLSFSQLTGANAVTNLQSASFAGGQFGSTYTPPGSTAVYTVQYSVTPVPATGAPNYLQVSVQVTTPAVPAPPYTATMATIVMNPSATSNSSSPSPSPSVSPSPSPSPSASATSGPYSLTVLVSNSYVNPTTGVTVTQTNVTPNVTDTPAQQVPTTSSPVAWGGLASGSYLVTCNYYQGGKQNKPATLTQTVTISGANQTITFTLN
jgi:prepilin-type N-terminal cleavage/methylation domain-containing protein